MTTMTAPWIKFLEDLKDEALILAKDELKDLILTSLTDSDAFIKKQAVKLDRYLTQLALGEISKVEFEEYMKDLEALTRLQSLKLEVAAKARAQRLADGIQNLILDKLLNLI